MKIRKFKSTFFHKILSFLIIFSLAFPNVSSFAQPTMYQTFSPIPGQFASLDISDIGVPRDSGMVRSKFHGNGENVIIHIQDAHCNYEVQQNIYQMLKQLVKSYGIDFIAVEGADGLLETSWFRSFPNAAVRKKVVGSFMEKGEISAAEYFSIVTEHPITLFGAENREQYVKNLRAFNSAYGYKTEIEKYMSSVMSVIERLKRIVFSPELLEFDRIARDFRYDNIGLSDYAREINRIASSQNINLSSFRNFSYLTDTLEYEEKIDFDIVEAERGRLIDVLGKKLSTEEMTYLVTKSVMFVRGELTPSQFYGYLRRQSFRNGVDLKKDYPNVFYYNIYTALYERVEHEGLFEELFDIEITVNEHLSQDPDQALLAKYSRDAEMVFALVNINMTNQDYAYFKRSREERDDIGGMLDFLRRLTRKYNLIHTMEQAPRFVSTAIDNMVDFYEIAKERDLALVENTLAEMEKRKTNVGVLISGGFHTKGIERTLKSKNISHIVVSPKITGKTESRYLEILTNQRAPVGDLEYEYHGAWRRSMGGTLAPYLMIGLVFFDETQLNELSEAIGCLKAIPGRRGIEERVRDFKLHFSEEKLQTWLLTSRQAAEERNLNVDDDKLVQALFVAIDAESRRQGLDEELLGDLKEHVKKAIASLAARSEGKRKGSPAEMLKDLYDHFGDESDFRRKEIEHKLRDIGRAYGKTTVLTELRVLRKLGLVERTGEGINTRYKLSDDVTKLPRSVVEEIAGIRELNYYDMYNMVSVSNEDIERVKDYVEAKIRRELASLVTADTVFELGDRTAPDQLRRLRRATEDRLQQMTGTPEPLERETVRLAALPEYGLSEGAEVQIVKVPGRVEYEREFLQRDRRDVNESHDPDSPLSVDNLPAAEILYRVKINKTPYRVAINKHPHREFNILLISDGDEPQHLTGRVEDTLLFSQALGEEFTAAFHSPGGAASVMHFHVHIYKNRPALLDNIESGAVQLDEDGLLRNWPAEGKVISSQDLVDLSEQVESHVTDFHEKGVPYNIGFARRDGTYYAFIFPRDKEYPLPGATQGQAGLMKTGVNDLWGEMGIYGDEAFIAFQESPELIAAAMHNSTRGGTFGSSEEAFRRETEKRIELYDAMPGDAKSPVYFNKILNTLAGEFPAYMLPVRIVFDSGEEAGSYVFSTALPKEGLLNEELESRMARNLAIFLKGKLEEVGARKKYLTYDKSVASLVEAAQDKLTKVPYKEVIEALQRSHGEFHIVEANDESLPERQTADRLAREAAEREEREIAAYSRGPAGLKELSDVRDTILGIDVGGSDIKVMLMSNNRELFAKKFNWEPEEFSDGRDHLDVMETLSRLALLKLALVRMDELDKTPEIRQLEHDVDQVADRSYVSHAENEEAASVELSTLKEHLEKAEDLGLAIARPDAIGFSWPDVIVGDEIVGADTNKTRNLSTEHFDNYIRPLPRIISNRLSGLRDSAEEEERAEEGGIPYAIRNDGDVGAFFSSVMLDRGNLASIVVGTSLAGGFVNPEGRLADLRNYFSRTIVDGRMEQDLAEEYDVTRGVPGVAAMYVSQRGMERVFIRECSEEEREELDFDSKSRIERMRKIQELFKAGDTRAEKAFEEAGRYIGALMANVLYSYNSSLPIKDFVFAGRWMLPEAGGEVMLDSARETLKDLFPGLPEINFHYASDLAGGDDRVNEFSQAVGAIFLANQELIRTAAAPADTRQPFEMGTRTVDGTRVREYDPLERSTPVMVSSVDKTIIITSSEKQDSADKGIGIGFHKPVRTDAERVAFENDLENPNVDVVDKYMDERERDTIKGNVIPAREGDVFTIRAGTPYYLADGVSYIEIGQEGSETRRLWDWNDPNDPVLENERAAALEIISRNNGFEATSEEDHRKITRRTGGDEHEGTAVRRLAYTDLFAAEHLSFEEREKAMSGETDNTDVLLLCHKGSAEIVLPGQDHPVLLSMGESVLVSGDIFTGYTVKSLEEGTKVLKLSVPETADHRNPVMVDGESIDFVGLVQELMASPGVRPPVVAGRELSEFRTNRSLVEHLRDYCLIKDLQDIANILRAREMISRGNMRDLPGGFTHREVLNLYDALLGDNQPLYNRPLKIALIRGGSGGKDLAQELSGANTQISVLLSATDDGKSYFGCVRRLGPMVDGQAPVIGTGETGFPDIGKAQTDFIDNATLANVYDYSMNYFEEEGGRARHNAVVEALRRLVFDPDRGLDDIEGLTDGAREDAAEFTAATETFKQAILDQNNSGLDEDGKDLYAKVIYEGPIIEGADPSERGRNLRDDEAAQRELIDRMVLMLSSRKYFNQEFHTVVGMLADIRDLSNGENISMTEAARRIAGARIDELRTKSGRVFIKRLTGLTELPGDTEADIEEARRMQPEEYPDGTKKKLIGFLESFRKGLEARQNAGGFELTLGFLPLRTMVLYGATWENNGNRIQGIEAVNEALGIDTERFSIIPTTAESSHLVAVTRDAEFFPVETGLNEVERNADFAILTILNRTPSEDEVAQINRIKQDALADGESKEEAAIKMAEQVREWANESAGELQLSDEARSAVRDADIVVLTPTSVSNVPHRLGEVLSKESNALKVWFPNSTIENEPDGTSAADFLEMVYRVSFDRQWVDQRVVPRGEMGGFFDYIIGPAEDIDRIDHEREPMPIRDSEISEMDMILINQALESARGKSQKAGPIYGMQWRHGMWDSELMARNIYALGLMREAGYRVGENGELVREEERDVVSSHITEEDGLATLVARTWERQLTSSLQRERPLRVVGYDPIDPARGNRLKVLNEQGEFEEVDISMERLGEGHIKAMLTPGRSGGGARFEIFRKIPGSYTPMNPDALQLYEQDVLLDSEKPSDMRAAVAEVELDGRKYNLLLNKFPPAPNAFMVISSEVEPQILASRHIKAGLEFIQGNPSATLWFGSGGAGAASVNTMHFQGVIDINLPVKNAEVDVKTRIGSGRSMVEVGTLSEDFISDGIVFESADLNALYENVSEFTKILGKEGKAYDVLLVRNGDKFRFVIYIRKDFTGKFGPWAVSAVKASGFVSMRTPEVFEQLTEENVRENLKRYLLETADLALLLDKFDSERTETARLSAARSTGITEDQRRERAVRALNQGLALGGEDLQAGLVEAVHELPFDAVIERLARVARSVRDEETRINAIRGLGTFGSKRAVEVLDRIYEEDIAKKASNTDSFVIRTAVAEALGRIGGADAVRKLGNIVRDQRDPKTWQVKVVALINLGSTADPNALKMMFKLSDEQKKELREFVIETLDVYFESEKPWHQAERRLACIVAGELLMIDGEDDLTIGKVASILKNDSGKHFWQERRAAAETLGMIMLKNEEGELAIPQIEKGLSRELSSVVTPAVREGLSDPESWEVRRASAMTAGKLALRDTAVFNKLMSMVENDSYWSVRAAAAEALGIVGKTADGELKSGVEDKISAIVDDHSEDPEVRYHALKTLWALGFDQKVQGVLAETSEEAVEEILQSPVATVQRAWGGVSDWAQDGVRLTEEGLTGSVKESMDAKTEWVEANEIVQDLWTSSGVWNEYERERSRDSWLMLPREMQDWLPRFQAAVADRQEKLGAERITDVIVVGIGGAAFGNYVYRGLFGDRPDAPNMHLLDSSHNDAMKEVLDSIPEERRGSTIVIYSSKAGGAIGPRSDFKILYKSVFESRSEHFIVVTDTGFNLEEEITRANEKEGADFYLVPTKDNIGGRYSVMSSEMLTPATAMGAPLDDILGNAETRMKRKTRAFVPAAENPGVRLGTYLYTMLEQGRDKMTVFSSGEIAPFKNWVEMVFSENLGKDSTGIIPVVNETLPAPEELDEVYGQSEDRHFVFLRHEGDTSIDRHISELRDLGLEVLVIDVPEKESLGELFYLFEFGTVIAAKFMGVNPFDEAAFHKLKHNLEEVMAGIRTEDYSAPTRDYSVSGNVRFDYSRIFDIEDGFTREELAATLDAMGKSGELDKPADQQDVAAIYAAILHLSREKGRSFSALLPYTLQTDETLSGVYREWVDEYVKATGQATILRHGPPMQHFLFQLLYDGSNTGVMTFIGGQTYPWHDPSVPEVPEFKRDDLDNDPEVGMTLNQIVESKRIASMDTLAERNRMVLGFELEPVEEAAAELKAILNDAARHLYMFNRAPPADVDIAHPTRTAREIFSEDFKKSPGSFIYFPVPQEIRKTIEKRVDIGDYFFITTQIYHLLYGIPADGRDTTKDFIEKVSLACDGKDRDFKNAVAQLLGQASLDVDGTAQEGKDILLALAKDNCVELLMAQEIIEDMPGNVTDQRIASRLQDEYVNQVLPMISSGQLKVRVIEDVNYEIDHPTRPDDVPNERISEVEDEQGNVVYYRELVKQGANGFGTYSDTTGLESRYVYGTLTYNSSRLSSLFEELGYSVAVADIDPEIRIASPHFFEFDHEDDFRDTTPEQLQRELTQQIPPGKYPAPGLGCLQDVVYEVNHEDYDDTGDYARALITQEYNNREIFVNITEEMRKYIRENILAEDDEGNEIPGEGAYLLANLIVHEASSGIFHRSHQESGIDEIYVSDNELVDNVGISNINDFILRDTLRERPGWEDVEYLERLLGPHPVDISSAFRTRAADILFGLLRGDHIFEDDRVRNAKQYLKQVLVSTEDIAFVEHLRSLPEYDYDNPEVQACAEQAYDVLRNDLVTPLEGKVNQRIRAVEDMRIGVFRGPDYFCLVWGDEDQAAAGREFQIMPRLDSDSMFPANLTANALQPQIEDTIIASHAWKVGSGGAQMTGFRSILYNLWRVRESENQDRVKAGLTPHSLETIGDLLMVPDPKDEDKKLGLRMVIIPTGGQSSRNPVGNAYGKLDLEFAVQSLWDADQPARLFDEIWGLLADVFKSIDDSVDEEMPLLVTIPGDASIIGLSDMDLSKLNDGTASIGAGVFGSYTESQHHGVFKLETKYSKALQLLEHNDIRSASTPADCSREIMGKFRGAGSGLGSIYHTVVAPLTPGDYHNTAQYLDAVSEALDQKRQQEDAQPGIAKVESFLRQPDRTEIDRKRVGFTHDTFGKGTWMDTALFIAGERFIEGFAWLCGISDWEGNLIFGRPPVPMVINNPQEQDRADQQNEKIEYYGEHDLGAVFNTEHDIVAYVEKGGFQNAPTFVGNQFALRSGGMEYDMAEERGDIIIDDDYTEYVDRFVQQRLEDGWRELYSGSWENNQFEQDKFLGLYLEDSEREEAGYFDLENMVVRDLEGYIVAEIQFDFETELSRYPHEDDQAVARILTTSVPEDCPEVRHETGQVLGDVLWRLMEGKRLLFEGTWEDDTFDREYFLGMYFTREDHAGYYRNLELMNIEFYDDIFTAMTQVTKDPRGAADFINAAGPEKRWLRKLIYDAIGREVDFWAIKPEKALFFDTGLTREWAINLARLNAYWDLHPFRIEARYGYHGLGSYVRHPVVSFGGIAPVVMRSFISAPVENVLKLGSRSLVLESRITATHNVPVDIGNGAGVWGVEFDPNKAKLAAKEMNEELELLGQEDRIQPSFEVAPGTVAQGWVVKDEEGQLHDVTIFYSMFDSGKLGVYMGENIHQRLRKLNVTGLSDMDIARLFIDEETETRIRTNDEQMPDQEIAELIKQRAPPESDRVLWQAKLFAEGPKGQLLNMYLQTGFPNDEVRKLWLKSRRWSLAELSERVDVREMNAKSEQIMGEVNRHRGRRNPLGPDGLAVAPQPPTTPQPPMAVGQAIRELRENIHGEEMGFERLLELAFEVASRHFDERSDVIKVLEEVRSEVGVEFHDWAPDDKVNYIESRVEEGPSRDFLFEALGLGPQGRGTEGTDEAAETEGDLGYLAMREAREFVATAVDGVMVTPSDSTSIIAIDNALSRHSGEYRMLIQTIERSMRSTGAITVVRARGTELSSEVDRAIRDLEAQGTTITRVVTVADSSTASDTQFREAMEGEDRFIMSVDLENAFRRAFPGQEPDHSRIYVQFAKLFRLAILVAQDRDINEITRSFNELNQDSVEPDQLQEFLRSGFLAILPKLRAFDPADLVEAYKAQREVIISL